MSPDNITSQLISGETWSWPVAASSVRAATSTRARWCQRTRWCTVQTASGACRTKSHRSAPHCCLFVPLTHEARCLPGKQICVIMYVYFFLSCSLRLCSSISSWRYCPTTTTWARRWREAARLWETNMDPEEWSLLQGQKHLHTQILETHTFS